MEKFFYGGGVSVELIYRLYSSETFGNVVMWVIVGALLVTGFYSSSVLTLYSLVVVALLLIIVNMAAIISSRDGQLVLFSFSMTAWFLMGLFFGVISSWLGWFR